MGKVFGTIESVKTASDLYAPASGEVVEVNSVLVDEPQQVNEDPYGEGWMVKIRASDPAELERLLTSEQYVAQTGEECRISRNSHPTIVRSCCARSAYSGW